MSEKEIANRKMSEDIIRKLFTWLFQKNSQVVVRDLEIQSNFDNQAMQFLGIVFDEHSVDTTNDTITYYVNNGIFSTLIEDFILRIIFKFDDYSFESKNTTLLFSDIHEIIILFDEHATFESVSLPMNKLAKILSIIDKCDPQNDDNKLSTELAIEVISAGLGLSDKNSLETFQIAAAEVNLSANLYSFERLLE